jgi:preprotein translocase subunit SecD
VQQVRLYALKKTTSEGPAISSAVLDGKPMVAYAVFTHPHKFRNAEPVPIFVFLTSEARQLWYQFTTKITGRRVAIVMDDVVIQDWQVMCGIENGKFMIMREWSSKEELEAFCERLIKQ